jgi:hypothetical protein
MPVDDVKIWLLKKHRSTLKAHISAKRFMSFSLRRILSSRRSLSSGVRPSNSFADISRILFDLGVDCPDMNYDGLAGIK